MLAGVAGSRAGVDRQGTEATLRASTELGDQRTGTGGTGRGASLEPTSDSSSYFFWKQKKTAMK